MSWNYRVCKELVKRHQSLGGGKVAVYSIREVYYMDEEDKSCNGGALCRCKGHSWTAKPMSLGNAVSIKDLQEDFALMEKAFGAQVFDLDEASKRIKTKPNHKAPNEAAVWAEKVREKLDTNEAAVWAEKVKEKLDEAEND